MSSCASSISKFLFSLALLLSCTKFIAQTALPRKLVIDSILVNGNKKTRHGIVMREVNFIVGDSLTETELKEKCLRTQQNLMNTSLFVHDTVTYVIDTTAQKVSVQIKLHERWYFWPSLILQIQDRNFNAWWDQEHRDLNRLNYGVGFSLYNILGLNQTLTLIARKGYTEQFGFGYRIPYINKSKTLGLTAGFNFFRNNQVWYRTLDNGLLFYTDKSNYVRTETEVKLGLTYRHKLYLRNSFEVFLKNATIADTVTNLNADYFDARQRFMQYFSLQYRFSYDTRDYKPYALKGYVFDAMVVKDGLGVLKNETPDNFYLFASIKHQFKICNRVYMMNSVKGRVTPQYVPMYYFNRALGFTEVVRGYEYYVIDGQHYGLLKTNIRYQLVKPKTYHVPLGFLKKFTDVSFAIYTGPFADAGYVVDNAFAKLNPLSNSWLFGAGWGLDLVGYYDYVLRAEFTINKMAQPGFYLHFNAPL
jgi:hypothetical protein